MSIPMNLATAAFGLLLATPAFADCKQDIESLDQAVIAAETGASTGETGMPATKHQEQVLQGQQQQDSQTTGAIAGGGETTTPHQEQVTKEQPSDKTRISDLLGQARKLADAGNEAGCREKVTELKALLGTE
jgi:hypothetical protein